MKNSEPYIETVSGLKFPFLNPKDEDINIHDIAFSLSNQCRFNGHVQYYSVAEHCIMVSSMLPPDKQLAGLMHDAAEAYLSDIPSPVKAYLPDYAGLEKTVQDAINKKYGIDSFDPDVKKADLEATWTEARYLLDSNGQDWVPMFFTAKKKNKPYCMPPSDAYKAFMTVFTHLTKPRVLVET